MRFSDIVGSAADHLRGEMQSAQVVHAYLFAGPAGTGKRTLADICARALLCTGHAGERPCDGCPSCKQFLSGNHPDVIRMKPEKSIGVEAVRDMIDALAVHPYEAARHVVLIEEAEKMTAQAQNALLKTLETPPGDAVFFLMTDQMNSLLPTIISRCRTVRFSLLEETDAVRVLVGRGMAEKRAQLMARLSMGSVGMALEMEQSEIYWKIRDQAVRAVSALHGPEDVGVAAMSLAESRDQAGLILDILELCARDIMAAQDADGVMIQSDLQDELPLDRFSGEKMLMSVMEARRRLGSNVAWQSVLEMLFFDMAGGNHLWQL